MKSITNGIKKAVRMMLTLVVGSLADSSISTGLRKGDGEKNAGDNLGPALDILMSLWHLSKMSDRLIALKLRKERWVEFSFGN